MMILSKSVPSSKVCKKCGEARPIAAFSLKPNGSRVSPCRKCRNEYNRERIRSNPTAREAGYRATRRSKLLRVYGLTVEEADALLSKPCGICGGVAQHIDHDHVTGQVRGGLCGPCNRGIGQLRDDPALLEAAAAYLRAVV